MKIKSLYINSYSSGAGSLVTTIGMMRFVKHIFHKVAIFRPIVKTKNNNSIDVIFKEFSLKEHIEDSYALTLKEAHLLLSQQNTHDLLQKIVDKYKEIEENYDFVLIIGLGRSIFSHLIDENINLMIAKNLQAPILNILNANNKTEDEIVKNISFAKNLIKNEGLEEFAIFVNQTNQDSIDVLAKYKDKNIFFIPYTQKLNTITMTQVKDSLNATLIEGDYTRLHRISKGIIVASMQIENFLSYFI